MFSIFLELWSFSQNLPYFAFALRATANLNCLIIKLKESLSFPFRIINTRLRKDSKSIHYFESDNEFDEFTEKNDICFEKVSNKSKGAIKSIQSQQLKNLKNR